MSSISIDYVTIPLPCGKNMFDSSVTKWDTRYRLRNLLEVLTFSMPGWIEIAEALYDLRNPLSLTVLVGTVENKDEIVGRLRKVAHGCRQLNLPHAQHYAEELVKKYSAQQTLNESVDQQFNEIATAIEEKRPLPHKTLRQQVDEVTKVEIHPHVALRMDIQELKTHIDHELSLAVFMVVDEPKVDYCKNRTLFGKRVAKHFRSAAHDIEEAGKCIALNRWTAAVFHMMRVMEVGFRALAKSLKDPNLDPSRNPSWDSMLKKCDDELKKPAAQRCPEWNTDSQFFANATANLRAVKDAWRNPTMHIEAVYAEGIAMDIWGAVRTFTRHLATKLTE